MKIYNATTSGTFIEYSTEVSDVFQNFIIFDFFSLQIHAKTKFKTSKKFEEIIELQNSSQD